MLLNKFEFLHHLRVGFPRGIDLAQGKAVGIELGHIACIVFYCTTSSASLLNARLPRAAMQLDLADEETFALLNLLTETIVGDHYPFSHRLQTVRVILGKFGPMAPAPPPPARPRTAS